MKKSIPVIVVLLLIAGAAAYFYLGARKHGALGDLKAAEYVPSNTIGLVEITDLPRTKARWKETALYKIWQEPSVQAFFQNSKSLITHNEKTDAWLDKLQKADPKEIFVAVGPMAAPSGSRGPGGPKIVAGFDFNGSKQDANALVDELKANYKDAHPSGKTDIQKYGDVEIETFTYGSEAAAFATKDRWFLIATDLDLLKGTLDRMEGKGDAKTALSENATYKTVLAKLPKDSDGVLYLDAKSIIEPLEAELSAAELKGMDAFKDIQAIAAAFKFDGQNFRDAVYIYKPGGQASPLALNSMSYTSQQTVLYVASALNLDQPLTLPNAALDQSGVLAGLDALRQVLAATGVTFDDFKAAFGPELGVMVNWQPGAMQPTPVLVLDVRDKEKATKLLDALIAPAASAGVSLKQEVEGVQYYSIPYGEVAVTIALTDKMLVFSADQSALKAAIAAAKSGDGRLDKLPGYHDATNRIGKPTGAFGYVDTKTVFENVYGIATKALQVSAFFNPDVAKYGDLSKLPPAGDISKHLDPIVFSESSDENGITIESSGPITFSQILVVGAGIGFSYQNQMPTAAFPGMQGVHTRTLPPSNSVNPPPVAPAPPAPAAP